MRFPLSLTWSMSKYMFKKRLLGEDRFPLVLMLEPLHACNLTCTGCGRIREYKATLKEKLSVEECLKSVDECSAPIVSICGGEPLIYPQIGELVNQIIKRGKHIYLCTNGVYLEKKLNEFKPSSQFLFNVHLDGLEETHDLAVERKGVFKSAVSGIKAAKKAGFMVCSNTTVYLETDMNEIDSLFIYLKQFNVDGYMVSPSYSYASVKTKDIFMDRKAIHEKFKTVDRFFEKYKLMSSPIYLDYLKGNREEMPCAAFGNPTRNTKGWKSPCYLITDSHYSTFQELMEKTDWSSYGKGKDPRCADCMVHVGYEPAAALGYNKRIGDGFKMLAWQF